MFSPPNLELRNLLAYFFGKQNEHLDLNSIRFDSWLTEMAAETLLCYQRNQTQCNTPLGT